MRVRRRFCIGALLGGVLLLGAATAPPPRAEEPIPPLELRCEREVVELHRFLERWSNAELPATDEAFARFADVIAESFVIIDPDGTVSGRQPIVDAIRGAHGRWHEMPGKIRIEGYRLHHAAGGLALVTYEEWHDLGDRRVGRLSTALFGERAGTPNGVEWLHLHEVWLPTDGP